MTARRSPDLCHDQTVAAPADRHESGDLLQGAERRERLDAARLYLILGARPGGRAVDAVVDAALAGGVDLVQLRDKQLGERELVDVAHRLRKVCDGHGALLILNDRLDLVLESEADGVHLGQDDAPVDEARALLGADALIGVSTHSPEQVAAARESLADYMAVGPVHATPTKPGVAPVGSDLVRHAADHAAKPFFAIGGLNRDNVGQAVAAGARRVAVVRAIADADDPQAAARALRRALEQEVHAGAAS